MRFSRLKTSLPWIVVGGLAVGVRLRILLALGTLRLMHSDYVRIAGSQYRLFDVGGAVAIAGLAITFIASAAMNTRALYRAEPLPRPVRTAGSNQPPLKLRRSAGASA